MRELGCQKLINKQQENDDQGTEFNKSSMKFGFASFSNPVNIPIGNQS